MNILLWKIGLSVILFFAYVYFLIFCNKTWITYIISECLYNLKNKHPKSIFMAMKSYKRVTNYVFMSNVAIWWIKSKNSPFSFVFHLKLGNESQIIFQTNAWVILGT